MSQKWEYSVFSRSAGVWSDDRYDGRSPKEKLNDFGKEGWELVSVCYDNSGYNFYMKRLVPEKKRASRASTKKAATKSTK